MLRREHPVLRKLLWATGLGLLCGLTALLICFPGRQSLLAFTLATGIGIGDLQRQVDQVEEKAIHGQELSAAEKRFLVDLYSCFAIGGAVVAPQSSKMMHRYLSRTGESLAVHPAIFQNSAPVRNVMNELRKKVLHDLKGGRSTREPYSSDTFFMGDPAYFDSIVGLYFGKLHVSPRAVRPDAVVLAWRAEVPWTWPTYAELFQKYGKYHAQCFALPNARSLIQGPRYALHMDDGLGGHLATIGLAKPFLVYAEWEETLPHPGVSSHN